MTRIIRHIALILALTTLVGPGIITAQTANDCRKEFSVSFRSGYSSIDPSFGNNAATISDIVAFIADRSRDTSLVIKSIEFVGTSSPEGYIEANERLALKRAAALEQFIRERVAVPDSIVSTHTFTHWDSLIEAVRTSTLPNRQAVVDILSQAPSRVVYSRTQSEDARIVRLRKMDGGATWYAIKRRYLGSMRNAAAVFVTCTKREPTPTQEPAPTPTTVGEPTATEEPANEQTTPIVAEQPASEQPAPAVVEQPASEQPAPTVVEQPAPTTAPQTPQENQPAPAPQQNEWTRHLYLKTNAVGWALSAANLAVEIDLARHWSFALPVYYSGVDYFKSDLKFRIFTIQPEFRYWFRADNRGWFLGGHFGMAYYNFALQGKWRIQDHDGSSPSFGGGISAGYRMPIGRSGRWTVEFSVGGGVYSADYDKFYNKRNGAVGERVRKTFVGVDNVGVSFSYMFNLKKRNR